MSFALSAGVTGLQAHQKMLDIAGNNLANVNTTAFKASRITFAELLSETIKKASQPTSIIGGTNPQQMGSGVGVAGIIPSMLQGNLVNTGNPLDLAIEGQGYFVLQSPAGPVYSRAGTFAVDQKSNLVDPSTGYLVQRTGPVGESDKFQDPAIMNIHVPYDVPVAPKATVQMVVAGNLSANALLEITQTQKLTSNIAYTVGTTAAVATDEIDQLYQFSGGSETDGQLGATESGTITFSGYKPDGTSFATTGSSWVDLTMDVDADTTLQDVLTYLNTDDGIPVRDEVQTLTRDAQATALVFTITIGTETTADIAFDAPLTGVGSIEEALENLDAISDVTVTGEQISDVRTTGETVFTFGSAQDDVGDMTFNFDGCTGPTTAGSSVEETTKGRDAVRGVLGGDAEATLSIGQIVIEDTVSGYSQSDLTMSYAASGSETHSLEMPAYFELSEVGGDEVRTVNITVYDSEGGTHVLSGAFVRTDASNTWDMILTSITADIGDIEEITMDNRRIKDIEFDPAGDGSYNGLNTTTNDAAEFVITFEDKPAQTIAISMGTVGEFDGLTQFAGGSTAVAREQDGYAAGRLSSVSVDQEGTIIGAFSNGIKKPLATIQIALFQNPAALESEGGGYFGSSANSGEAVATQALSAGAGTIHGGSLERSNADVATEFVNMIQAQNGFQANARTIRVANEILRELTNLIR